MNYFWKGANSMLGRILVELKECVSPEFAVMDLRQLLTESLENVSPEDDRVYIVDGKLSLGEEGGDGEREDKKYDQVLLGQRAARRWVLDKLMVQEHWGELHVQVLIFELEEEMRKTEVLMRPPWFGALLSKKPAHKLDS
jgi:hypothetical protein